MAENIVLDSGQHVLNRQINNAITPLPHLVFAELKGWELVNKEYLELSKSYQDPL